MDEDEEEELTALHAVPVTPAQPVAEKLWSDEYPKPGILHWMFDTREYNRLAQIHEHAKHVHACGDLITVLAKQLATYDADLVVIGKDMKRLQRKFLDTYVPPLKTANMGREAFAVGMRDGKLFPAADVGRVVGKMSAFDAVKAKRDLVSSRMNLAHDTRARHQEDLWRLTESANYMTTMLAASQSLAVAVRPNEDTAFENIHAYMQLVPGDGQASSESILLGKQTSTADAAFATMVSNALFDTPPSAKQKVPVFTISAFP
jgi:hypothetical protein